MSSKLALKHKDSLALKENKLKHGEKQEVYKMKYRYLSLPCFTLSVFLVYWLIICPIIFAVCFFLFSSPYEPFIFWIISFLIWFIIMGLILICWRRSQVKQTSEISVISKYGSDRVGKPLGILQTSSEDAESLETKIDSERDPESDHKNDRKSKKELLPLVIHKRMSGENIEDTAVVHVEQDGETRSDVASDYVAKNPLQDYLQLVTISPTKDEEAKSLKTPMSPRDLFFIDLIRGAEEAEKANSSKSRTYFFPNETSENDTKKNAEERKKDTEDRKDVKDEDSRDEKDRTSESSYFIANVDTPVSEKTEVFLHIDPGVGADPKEVIVEKPVLLLQSNENTSQAN